MTIFLGSEDVTQDDAITFSVDASDLGFAPGFFPEHIETDLGNRQNLIRVSLDCDSAVYEQPAGCITVIIYND